MKTQTQVFRWLRANLGPNATSGLTSTDTHCLFTCVSLCNLISYESAPEDLFKAFAAVVREMQQHNRFLVFHVIAMELDWSHRQMIWHRAGLDQLDIRGRAKFGPEGGMPA